MERKLKYHEHKLLRKTNFVFWKKENNLREIQILRRYHIQRREDYTKYAAQYIQLTGVLTSRALPRSAPVFILTISGIIK